MQMKRIAGWGQFEERVFGGPMCLRPHMLLCPDSWGWLVITRPDRQSVWCFLTHWLSEAYLRFLQASGPGSCVFDRSCLELALLWLGGRGQGWVSRPVFLAKDTGCLISTVHLYTNCLFFISESCFMHRNSPLCWNWLQGCPHPRWDGSCRVRHSFVDLGFWEDSFLKLWLTFQLSLKACWSVLGDPLMKGARWSPDTIFPVGSKCCVCPKLIPSQMKELDLWVFSGYLPAINQWQWSPMNLSSKDRQSPRFTCFLVSAAVCQYRSLCFGWNHKPIKVNVSSHPRTPTHHLCLCLTTLAWGHSCVEVGMGLVPFVVLSHGHVPSIRVPS